MRTRYFLVIHTIGKRYWNHNFQIFVHHLDEATIYKTAPEAIKYAKALARDTGYEVMVWAH